MPFWNWMLAEDKLTKKLRYFSFVHYTTKNRDDWDSRNCRFLGKHFLGFLKEPSVFPGGTKSRKAGQRLRRHETIRDRPGLLFT